VLAVLSLFLPPHCFRQQQQREDSFGRPPDTNAGRVVFRACMCVAAGPTTHNGEIIFSAAKTTTAAGRPLEILRNCDSLFAEGEPEPEPEPERECVIRSRGVDQVQWENAEMEPTEGRSLATQLAPEDCVCTVIRRVCCLRSP
jgi:hypothetical protein